jgi:hypothetical protein
MKPINVELTHGHSIGMSGHYYTPSESDVLKDYMSHAADTLTIDQSQRLKSKVEELEGKQAQDIASLKERLNNTEELLNKMHEIAERYTDFIDKSGKGYRRLISNMRTLLKKEGKWTDSLASLDDELLKINPRKNVLAVMRPDINREKNFRFSHIKPALTSLLLRSSNQTFSINSFLAKMSPCDVSLSSLILLLRPRLLVSSPPK